jgi:hypothetical protein
MKFWAWRFSPHAALQGARIQAFLVQEIASALDAIELRRLGVRFPKELGRRLRWDDDRWADKYGLQEFFDTFRFRWSDFRDVLEELDLARMNVHDCAQFRIFAVGLPGHTSTRRLYDGPLGSTRHPEHRTSGRELHGHPEQQC